MGFILQNSSRRQHQHLLQDILDSSLGGFIGSALVPHRDDILMVADTQDGPADFMMADGELVAEEGDDEVFPETGGDAFP